MIEANLSRHEQKHIQQKVKQQFHKIEHEVGFIHKTSEKISKQKKQELSNLSLESWSKLAFITEKQETLFRMIRSMVNEIEQKHNFHNETDFFKLINYADRLLGELIFILYQQKQVCQSDSSLEDKEAFMKTSYRQELKKYVEIKHLQQQAKELIAHEYVMAREGNPSNHSGIIIFCAVVTTILGVFNLAIFGTVLPVLLKVTPFFGLKNIQLELEVVSDRFRLKKLRQTYL